jgi:hypothetical protein
MITKKKPTPTTKKEPTITLSELKSILDNIEDCLNDVYPYESAREYINLIKRENGI